jgi:hypothetical protein
MEKPPKGFTLGGHEIKVVIVKDLAETEDATGRWRPALGIIEVQGTSKALSQDYQNQAFWHEAVHAALDYSSYDKLSKNEKLVDRLGQAMYQIVKTMYD